MSCKTCDHTMQSIGALPNTKKVFWCPRCGTLKAEFSVVDRVEWDVPTTYVPRGSDV